MFPYHHLSNKTQQRVSPPFCQLSPPPRRNAKCEVYNNSYAQSLYQSGSQQEAGDTLKWVDMRTWLMNFLQRLGQGWRTDGGITEQQGVSNSGEMLVALLGLKRQGKEIVFLPPERARAVEVGFPNRGYQNATTGRTMVGRKWEGLLPSPLLSPIHL